MLYLQVKKNRCSYKKEMQYRFCYVRIKCGNCVEGLYSNTVVHMKSVKAYPGGRGKGLIVKE